MSDLKSWFLTYVQIELWNLRHIEEKNLVLIWEEAMVFREFCLIQITKQLSKEHHKNDLRVLRSQFLGLSFWQWDHPIDHLGWPIIKKKLAVSHQSERIIHAITGAMNNLDRLKELAKVKEIFT